MSFYPYTVLKNALSYTLTRRDYENILSSRSVDQALKNLVDKAVGIYIYTGLQEMGRYTLRDVFELIDKYESLKINNAYKKAGRKARLVFNELKRFIDAINMFIVATELIHDRKPTFLLPLSHLSLAAGEGKIDFYSLPRITRLVLMEALGRHGFDPSMIQSLIPARSFLSLLSKPARNVYGILHDAFSLKLCMEYNVDPVYLVVMDRDSFREACGQKSLTGLLNVLRTSNIFTSMISDFIQMASRYYKGRHILVVSSIFTASRETVSLIRREADIALKLFVLSIGEAILLRYALISVDSGFLSDFTREIITGWWPL